MKIAYLAYLKINVDSGVNKKIAEQLSCWRSAGHDARLFALAPGGAETCASLAGLAPDVESGVGLHNLFWRARRQMRRLRQWRPDVIYVRYGIYIPAWAAAARHFPLALEINSDDLIEARQNWPWFLYHWHRCSRNFLLRRARGAVFVTDELRRRFDLPAARQCVISNGIDLDACPELPPAANSGPKLVFIGSAKHSWHGVVKIAWLADRRPDWRFDLIGIEEDELLDCPGNLRCHGFMARTEYLSLLADADVAIGTLAIHINQMNEACPLKVREYLAMGLPIIIGYQDTDFPPPPPDFILQLSNHELNVEEHLAQIDAFVERWRGRRVARSAVAHLAEAAKEAQRLAFFSELRHATVKTTDQ